MQWRQLKMENKAFDKIIGKKSTNHKDFLGEILGKTKATSWYLRDSDGDKVINILDCQPYNKHKQGIVDEIKEDVADESVTEMAAEARGTSIKEEKKAEERTMYDAVKEKVKGKVDEYLVARKERKAEEAETRKKINAAVKEEKEKASIEVAVYRERAKVKQQKKQIDTRMSQGSGFSGFVNSFVPPPPKGKKEYKQYKTKKQGKRMLPEVFTGGVNYNNVGMDMRKGSVDMFGIQKSDPKGIPDLDLFGSRRRSKGGKQKLF